jgi:hypothetical protein
LTGRIENKFDGGYCVSVLIQGISYTGIILEEPSAVEMWKLPNDTHVPKAMQQLSVLSANQFNDQENLKKKQRQLGEAYDRNRIPAAILNSLQFTEAEDLSSGESADDAKTSDSAEKHTRSYVKSGLYSKKRQAELLAAGLPVPPPPKRIRKRRPVRTDNNAPKAPRSAYNLFEATKAAKLKAANSKPERDLVEAQFDWRKISEQDKEPYKQLATADKNRYESEMAGYHQYIKGLQASGKLAAGNSSAEGDSDDESEEDDDDIANLEISDEG